MNGADWFWVLATDLNMKGLIMKNDTDISWIVALVLFVGLVVAFLDIQIWRP